MNNLQYYNEKYIKENFRLWLRELLEERKQELELEQPRIKGVSGWIEWDFRIREINHLLLIHGTKVEQRGRKAKGERTK